MKNLPYEFNDNTWLQITFEMDLNREEYERSRYTFFDMLSDVGGLSGMFTSIFFVFMNVWNFNQLDDYMVSRLFKSKPGEKKFQAEPLPAKTCCNLKDFLRSWTPNCLLCCKLNRREKAFAKARDKLESELNVIELIKSMRYFAKALKTLISADQRLKLREKTRYFVIDPESEKISNFETSQRSDGLGDI